MREMAELLGKCLCAEQNYRHEEQGLICLQEEEVQDIYLPNKDRVLRPVSELCLDDCDWLEESDTMHFLHPKFSEHLARVFRVRSKREHDEVSELGYFFMYCMSDDPSSVGYFLHVLHV